MYVFDPEWRSSKTKKIAIISISLVTDFDIFSSVVEWLSAVIVIDMVSIQNLTCHSVVSLEKTVPCLMVLESSSKFYLYLYKNKKTKIKNFN